MGCGCGGGGGGGSAASGELEARLKAIEDISLVEVVDIDKIIDIIIKQTTAIEDLESTITDKVIVQDIQDILDEYLDGDADNDELIDTLTGIIDTLANRIDIQIASTIQTSKNSTLSVGKVLNSTLKILARGLEVGSFEDLTLDVVKDVLNKIVQSKEKNDIIDTALLSIIEKTTLLQGPVNNIIDNLKDIDKAKDNIDNIKSILLEIKNDCADGCNSEKEIKDKLDDIKDILDNPDNPSNPNPKLDDIKDILDNPDNPDNPNPKLDDIKDILDTVEVTVKDNDKVVKELSNELLDAKIKLNLKIPGNSNECNQGCD